MPSDITIEKVIMFLLETPIFEKLDELELSEVLKVLQIRRARDGQLVFKEEDVGDGWYVVYEGEVIITKTDPGKPERVVAILGPRSCFGEMAVLDGSHRSATVRTRGETILLKFPRESFEGLLVEGNLAAYKLVLEMAKVLSQRQRRLNQQLQDLVSGRGMTDAQLRDQIHPLLDDNARSH